MPGISEAVVIGMPHPEWGEAVVAVISLAPGATLNARDVTEFCRSRVAKFEVPKHVEIMDSLPQGNTNKIDKLGIKKMLAGRMPWPTA